MQRGEQTFRRLALRLQGAVGEEARTIERHGFLEARRCVILDELHRAAAREEREHRIRLLLGDLREERLELDFRKRHIEFADDTATGRAETFLEGADVFFARSILPGDRHRCLMALLRHHLSDREARLPVRERGTENVGRAGGARGVVRTGVRDDHQLAALARDLDHRHLHTGMHGADHDIDLLAVDELVHVVGAFRRFGLIVDHHIFNQTPAELAALLLHVLAECAIDILGERSIRARVRQHETDAQRRGLRNRGRRESTNEKSGRSNAAELERRAACDQSFTHSEFSLVRGPSRASGSARVVMFFNLAGAQDNAFSDSNFYTYPGIQATIHTRDALHCGAPATLE